MGKNSRYHRETRESGWKEMSLIGILLFPVIFGIAVCWGLWGYYRIEKNQYYVGRWEADCTELGAPQILLIASNNGRIVFTNGDREIPYYYKSTGTSSLAFDRTINITGAKYDVILTLFQGNEKLRCRFTHYRDSHTVIYHRVPEYQKLGPIFPEGKESPGIVSRLKVGIPNADTRFEVALPVKFDLQHDYIISPVSGFVNKITKTGLEEEQISIEPYPPLKGVYTNTVTVEKVYVTLNHIHAIKKVGDFVQLWEPVARVSARARRNKGLSVNTVSILIRLKGKDQYVDYDPASILDYVEFVDKIAPQVGRDPKLLRQLFDDLPEPNK